VSRISSDIPQNTELRKLLAPSKAVSFGVMLSVSGANRVEMRREVCASKCSPQGRSTQHSPLRELMRVISDGGGFRLVGFV
jgi:hypothetical protein